MISSNPKKESQLMITAPNLIFFRGKKLIRSKWRMVNMTLKGSGLFDNLTLSTSDHTSMFYSSADWLVRHQDDNGGWPIQVRRKMASGLIDLAPGWYSAMGQGQAMSLLMRAFNRSGTTSVTFLSLYRNRRESL